ncbi:site-specific DNA-methyltransferase [Henriciella algicola]|uniref:site-specific DNA-methyltransferase (adenine-specific) n=1 Tax=Henriciella algicola TaxID=1608422 RepID=A0A399RIR4_9PROT|nr:DNA methyltransferase [Henriciella algicola]RIJ29635.1 DNA methylase N-4 [Henriciella algicola]
MTESHIEYLDPRSLTPWKNNARTHSRKQLRQIKASIRRFKFTNPVLIDEDNRIMAGHGRVEAAKSLGMDTVPCLRIEHLSEAEKRAYVLADNKLALNAGWDEDLLRLELGALSELDLDFDLEITGFDTHELDFIIEGADQTPASDPKEETVPALNSVPRRCEPGDIWQLGRHRLMCADARNPMTIRLLMAGKKAEMVFTDPPYNVAIDGNVCGSGSVKHREFAMASGEMSKAEFTGFLRDTFEVQRRYTTDGSIHFVCMDWRHMGEILAAGEAVYSELKNVIAWVKDNGGMGTFYRSRHELIFAFKNGSGPHINNFELGQHGRYRTNVWHYRGMNSAGANRAEELAMHPTVKPVEMIADAIRDVSTRNGIVLDLFGGSGSTLLAAEKTGRCAYLAEIDPLYCDVILHRWETFAKGEAERVRSGAILEEGVA